MIQKTVITIAKELIPFKCKICKKMVDINVAKPWTIETDTHIIHTWNYGHQHRRVFEFVGDEQYLIEGYED